MVNTKIRLIIFFAAEEGEALHSQQKQDQELTVAQIMNSLLQYSDSVEENWENHCVYLGGASSKEPTCQCRKVKSESEVAQSFLTLSNPEIHTVQSK